MSWVLPSWGSSGWTLIEEDSGGLVPLSGLRTVERTVHNKLDDFASAADWGFRPSASAAANVTAWNNIMADADGSFAGILIPPGIYTIDSPLIVTKPDLKIFGHDPTGAAGAGGVYIRSSNLTAPVMHFYHNNSTAFAGRNYLSGVKLGYTGAGSTSTYALRITNCAHLTIADVTIWPEAGTAIGNGILIESTLESPLISDIIWIVRCKITGLTQNAIVIGGTDATHRTGGTQIERCLIAFNGGDGVQILDFVEGVYITNGCDFFDNEHAVRIEAASISTNTRNIIISGGAVLDGSRQNNLRVTNAVRVHVLGAWVSFTNSTNSVPGIYLSENTERCVIAGNAIHAHNAGGIEVRGHHNVIVANGIFDNPGTGGGLSILLTASSHDNRVIGNAGFIDTLITDLGSNNIIGPNVGENGNVHLHDVQFYTAKLTGNPLINFDPNDFFTYVRSSNLYDFLIASAVKFRIGAATNVSFNRFEVIDSNFALDRPASDPILLMDATDSFRYIRSADRWEWVIGDVVKAILESAGLKTNRLYGNQASTAWTTARFTLSSTWGSTASVSNISATDARGMFRVNSGGTGRAANPTIDLTFADGAWIAPPVILAMQITGTDNIGLCFVQNITTTSFRITWAATPGDGQFYEFAFMCIG
ncbi:MAG TPA: hypothetical protein VNP04_15455 [Alphaproteobacteria bacterium]|nr:hypothetical protein [Alphaproteobacteria bacterium]